MSTEYDDYRAKIAEMLPVMGMNLQPDGRSALVFPATVEGSERRCPAGMFISEEAFGVPQDLLRRQCRTGDYSSTVCLSVSCIHERRTLCDCDTYD